MFIAGEMMMSLLWYYRPEHTEQGRLPADQPDEVFASRHKDSNSVACIDDKCYVLTFHEYCRYLLIHKYYIIYLACNRVHNAILSFLKDVILQTMYFNISAYRTKFIKKIF